MRQFDYCIIGYFSDCLDRLATARERTSSYRNITTLCMPFPCLNVFTCSCLFLVQTYACLQVSSYAKVSWLKFCVQYGILYLIQCFLKPLLYTFIDLCVCVRACKHACMRVCVCVFWGKHAIKLTIPTVHLHISCLGRWIMIMIMLLKQLLMINIVVLKQLPIVAIMLLNWNNY